MPLQVFVFSNFGFSDFSNEKIQAYGCDDKSILDYVGSQVTSVSSFTAESCRLWQTQWKVRRKIIVKYVIGILHNYLRREEGKKNKKTT